MEDATIFCGLLRISELYEIINLTTVFLGPGLALFLCDTRLPGFKFAEGYNFFVALLPRGLGANFARFVLTGFLVPDP